MKTYKCEEMMCDGCVNRIKKGLDGAGIKNTVDLSWTMFFIPKMTAIFILICMCPTAMTEADPMQSFLHYPDMKDYISRGWEKICTVKTSDSPPGSIIRR